MRSAYQAFAESETVDNFGGARQKCNDAIGLAHTTIMPGGAISRKAHSALRTREHLGLAVIASRIWIGDRLYTSNRLDIGVGEAVMARTFEAKSLVPGVGREALVCIRRVGPVQPGSDHTSVNRSHVDFRFEVVSAQSLEAI